MANQRDFGASHEIARSVRLGVVKTLDEAELNAGRALAAAEGLVGADPWGATARFAALFATHGGIVAAGYAIGSTWAHAAASLLAGLTAFGIAIGGHEAAHGSLTRNRRASTAIGTLVMASFLVPFATYKRVHLQHHARLNTDDDPEGNLIYTSLGNYVLLTPLFGVGFFAYLWAISAKISLGRSPMVRSRIQRWRISRNNVVSLVISAGFVTGAVVSPVVRWAWMWPMLSAFFWWSALMFAPEHYGLPSTSPTAATRSTRSNLIVRWATFQLGRHTAHHLAPGVPARKLPELEQRLGLTPAPESTRGYLFFQWEIIRSLMRRDGRFEVDPAPKLAEPV